MTDLLTMNKIMQEYNQLVKSGISRSFQAKFISILKAITLLLRVDIRHFNVLGAARIGTIQKRELENNILVKAKVLSCFNKIFDKNYKLVMGEKGWFQSLLAR